MFLTLRHLVCRFLSCEEIKKLACMQLQREASPEEIRLIMSMFGTNEDGKISLEEWEAWVFQPGKGSAGNATVVKKDDLVGMDDESGEKGGEKGGETGGEKSGEKGGEKDDEKDGAKETPGLLLFSVLVKSKTEVDHQKLAIGVGRLCGGSGMPNGAPVESMMSKSSVWYPIKVAASVTSPGSKVDDSKIAQLKGQSIEGYEIISTREGGPAGKEETRAARDKDDKDDEVAGDTDKDDATVAVCKSCGNTGIDVISDERCSCEYGQRMT